MTNTDNKNYIEMRSTSGEPFLQNDNLQVSFNLTTLEKITLYLEKLSTFIPLFSLGIFFILGIWGYIIYLKKKNNWIIAYYSVCTLTVSIFLSKLLYFATSSLNGKTPQVYDAVGFSNYTGYAGEISFRVFWIIFLGCGIFTLLTSIALQSIKREREISLTKNIKKGKYSPWFPTFFIFLYLILNFPYIHYLSTYLPEIINISDFDISNSIIWQYFRYLQLMPFRDFWYIYGGFYYTLLPSPPDAIFVWIHRSFLFGISLFSLYKIFGFSKKRTIICIIFFWLIQAFMPSTQRYFLSVSVVLLFASSIISTRRSAFFFLGCYISYVFFMEPVQLVYALPAFCILLISNLLLKKQGGEKINFIKKFIFVFYSSFLLIAFYFLYLQMHNALKEYLNLYINLGAMANYSMKPFGILNSAYSSFSLLGMYWWIILIFFLLTLLHITNKLRKNITFEDFIPLSLAVLSTIVFQKSLIRPMTDGLEIALFSAIFFICQSNFSKLEKQRIILAGGVIFIGFFSLVFFTKNRTAYAILKNYSQRAFNIHKDISALFLDQKKWMEVEEKYFLPQRFTIDGINGNEFKKNISKKMNLEKKDDLFVLGDDSYLYIILEQQAPSYVTFYNQSILYSQKDTVNWIEAHKPKYVIWRNEFKDFDGVPNYTRVPIVFEKVIQNYKFKDVYGSFLILENKDANEKIDFEFWRKYLGDTVQLGFIPGRSEPSKFEVKRISNLTNTQELNFLTINIRDPMQGRQREVSFNIDGKIYKISFQEEENIFSYNTNLQRIWFWKISHDMGLDPRLNSDFSVDSHPRIRKIKTTRDILY